MDSHSTRRTLLAALGAQGLLAACGGGSSAPAPAPAPAPPPDPSLQFGTVQVFDAPPAWGSRALPLSDGRQLLTLHGMPEHVVWMGRYPANGRTPDLQQQLYAGSANCCTLALPSGTRSGADANGGAVLAWMERSLQAPFDSVVIARLRADGSLGPRVRAATQPGHAVSAFDLAVRSDGTAMLAWAEAGPIDAIVPLGPTRILAAEFDLQGRLGEAQQVSTETMVDHQIGNIQVHAASSDNGHRLVAWTLRSRSGNGNDLLRASRAAPGAAWQPETQLSAPFDATRDPRIDQVQLRIDHQGEGLVVWQFKSDSATVQQAQLCRLRAVGGFGSAEVFAQSVQQLRLASGAGRHVIALRASSSGPAPLRLATINGGNAAVQLEDLDLGVDSIQAVDLGMLADGHLVLVWSAMPAAGLAVVRSRQRRPDGVWSAAISPSPANSAAQFDPQLVLLGPQHGLLSWREGPTSELWRVSLRR